MTALVVDGPGRAELRRLPIPAAGEDEVLLRVRRCGVCGTDLGIVSGAFPIAQFPIVPGHECTGTVAEIGARVSHLELDQRVIVDPIVPCGTCHMCRYERPALCTRPAELGIHRPGGLAEYVVAPGRNVHPLLPTLSFVAGALVEPLACAIHGQDRAGLVCGESVAVIGGGLQGLLHAMLAKLGGAAHVIVSARHRRRRQQAEAVGAELVLDPAAVDPTTAVLEATDSRGADVVIEASGTAKGLETALQVIAPGGRLVIHGAAPPLARVRVSPFQIFEREISIVGSCGGTGSTWPRALALMGGGTIDPARLVDSEWALGEAPRALNELQRDRQIVKGLIRMDGTA